MENEIHAGASCLAIGSIVFQKTILPTAHLSSCNNDRISITVNDFNTVKSLSFNTPTTLAGLPMCMELYENGQLEMIVDFPSDYNGTPFKYVNGPSIYYGTFKNGKVWF